MTDQELELELNEAGRARRPPARSTTCLGILDVSSVFGTYRMFVEDIAFSNCALNMACEILQLELGNMNLRLFGSPGKFYGQAQAHVVVYEGKIREKPSSKEEARQFIKGIYHESATESETEFKNSVSDSVSDFVSD
ncbi:hypothetical protein Syun_014866 [Stephania yunnanensis]|uniref:Uncharacterized protein n=1 Tax=Stephania yunnanensis TaxID=152371 RepID=A0AAP0PCB8_9MAGN